jgi:hypothetical protein
MWNELDEEERQGFHELSLKLAEEWKNETERVKVWRTTKLPPEHPRTLDTDP